MKKGYILAIDQSTSGTKAMLVNSHGHILQKESVAHTQIYQKPGWVEHNPNEIYENVVRLINNVVEKSAVPTHELKVLAITNQRETIVMWDKETGEPVYNAIVWQCRRTTDMCKTLKERGYEEIVQEKTGLTIDPYFSATKIKWLMENVEGISKKARQGKLLLGTMDSWLIWKLTGGKVHATDYTNASRTLLFNIETLQWDDELLDIFSVPKSVLPKVLDSNAIFGYTEDKKLPFNQLSISGVIGDSQGALFGQKCFSVGDAKATYGTGTSVMMNTVNLVKGKNGLVTSIAWSINGKVTYGLEGIINSTGDAMKWIKEELELFNGYDEVSSVASSLTDNEGVYFVPAFVGLGAPYWSPYTRAAILGITRSTGKPQIIRAALESIAYLVRDAVEMMEHESGIKIMELNVDGGATSNNFLMQFQADILDKKVSTSNVAELSSMGSVYLAGLGVGIWDSMDEICKLNQTKKLYKPLIQSELRSKYYEGWKQAVNRILVF